MNMRITKPQSTEASKIGSPFFDQPPKRARHNKSIPKKTTKAKIIQRNIVRHFGSSLILVNVSTRARMRTRITNESFSLNLNFMELDFFCTARDFSINPQAIHSLVLVAPETAQISLSCRFFVSAISRKFIPCQRSINS